MGIFDLIDRVKESRNAKWKVVYSSSTSSSPISISGQLGYYEMLGKAIVDMKARLPEIGGLFGEYLGSAKLLKKVNGKWKLHGEYRLTPEGNLYRLK